MQLLGVADSTHVPHGAHTSVHRPTYYIPRAPPAHHFKRAHPRHPSTHAGRAWKPAPTADWVGISAEPPLSAIWAGLGASVRLDLLHPSHPRCVCLTFSSPSPQDPATQSKKLLESTRFQELRVAAGEGFEPSHTESESAVLPLHNPARCGYYYTRSMRKVKHFFHFSHLRVMSTSSGRLFILSGKTLLPRPRETTRLVPPSSYTPASYSGRRPWPGA